MANTTVIEQCQISPAAVDDQNPEAELSVSLPIVFLDMLWFGYPANQGVFFFDFPNCSRSNFLDTVVPHMKKSLSLALSHFLPLAGNIVYTPKPEGYDHNSLLLCYTPGDSVSLVVSEAHVDLHQLTGNHPRICADFYVFAPLLPEALHTERSIACPVFAFQVTLFPGQGIALGFAVRHAAVDFRTLISFIRAWALINKNDLANSVTSVTAARLDEAKLLPDYNRENFVNITSRGLGSLFWDKIVLRCSSLVEAAPVKIPDTNHVRSTLVLKKEEIQKLKEYYYVSAKDSHLSSFVAICAFVWVCSAKAAEFGGEIVSDEEPDYFLFPADCRSRTLDFEVLDNYLGNCLAPVLVELKHGVLKSNDGYAMVVKSIREAIQKRVYGDNDILHGAEEWPEIKKLLGKRTFGVAGSPNVNLYEVDFGWGIPNKYEDVSIDMGGAISLCRSPKFEGGLEIGVSKPKTQMDAFVLTFNQLLQEMICICHL